MSDDLKIRAKDARIKMHKEEEVYGVYKMEIIEMK